MVERLRNRQAASQFVFDLRASCTTPAPTKEGDPPEGLLHERQFNYCNDEALYVLAKCARRTGKTESVPRVAVKAAYKPGGNNNILYMTLTRPQAKQTLWVESWQPFLEKNKIPNRSNETELTTYFDNGSRVYFCGTDDVEYIKSKLGAKLTLAIIDEAQDQPPLVFRNLVERILPPALNDRRGQLRVQGTFPEVPAGPFYELWNSAAWSKHCWAMSQNPWMPNWRATLQEYLDANPHISIDDPVIQRDYFAMEVYGTTRQVYHFTERNYLDPVPDWGQNRKLYRFVIGLDFGWSDRTAIVVLGQNMHSQNVYLFDEAMVNKTTIKPGQGWVSEIAKAVQKFVIKYEPESLEYDPAGMGAGVAHDLSMDYDVPLMCAAKKTDLRGRIAKVNELLTRGLLLLVKESKTAEDFTKTTWDERTQVPGGVWKYARQYHPDFSEAVNMAITKIYSSWFDAPAARRIQMTQLEREIEDALREIDIDRMETAAVGDPSKELWWQGGGQ